MAKHDDELDPDPESTWGATEEYKRRWDAKYGKGVRKAAEERDAKPEDKKESTK
jgi:hypothetical protein